MGIFKRFTTKRHALHDSELPDELSNDLRKLSVSVFTHSEQDQYLRELRQKVDTHKRINGLSDILWNWRGQFAFGILFIIFVGAGFWWQSSNNDEDIAILIDSNGDTENLYLTEFERVNSQYVLASAVIFDVTNGDK